MMWPPRPTTGLKPVVTPLGKLWGRDCIYLDAYDYDVAAATLIMRGDINGDLCEPAMPQKRNGYEVRFLGVIDHEVFGVDNGTHVDFSSFHEVIHAGLKSPLRRYIFATYDDVFRIDCNGFVFVRGDGPD